MWYMVSFCKVEEKVTNGNKLTYVYIYICMYKYIYKPE
jgi:hypothetical protein